MDTSFCVKVYSTEPVKIGQPIIGWDNKAMETVITTPVSEIQHVEKGVVAITEEGGAYHIVNHR